MGAAPGGPPANNDNVNGNWSYTYDDFDRLVTSSQSGQAFSYVYDRFGNRWQQNVTAGSGPQPSYSFTGGNNRIDGYSYDAAGNLLNDGNHSYSYDAENRVIQVDGGSTATYVYDAEGRRVRKTAGGSSVTYLYDLGDHEITELTSSGGWNRGEVYGGGQHVATYNNSTTYFAHSDSLGSERLRSDINGMTYSTWSSLPFGEGASTPNPSPMHLTGKERDSESGLDYFGARYYANAMGRWLSADWSSVPVAVPYADLSNPQTLNLYAYVGNNPATGIDKDGHIFAAPGPGDPSHIGLMGDYTENTEQNSNSNASTQADQTSKKDHTIEVQEVKGEGANVFDHVAVSVDEHPAVGFGPKKDPSVEQLEAEASGKDLKGTAGTIEPPKKNQPVVEKVKIAVTAKQAAAAQKVIDERTKDPGNYHVTLRNCTQFAEAALAAAGQSPHGDDIKPSTLLHDLIQDQKRSQTVAPH